MTSIKKLLSVVLALAMLLCVLPISVSAEETATEPISFVYDFNSEASLAAFHAYYLPVTGYWDNMVGTAEELSAHWELAAVDGAQVVRRTNLTEGENPGTGSCNAMLYLAESYRYFEAEMSFLFGNSWGWAQLCFGAANMGNHMHNDNAGVYMQQEGHVNLSCPGGNDTQVNVEGDFTKAGLHTIKLRVEKGSADDKINITVWADGVQKISKQDVYAENFSDRAGYISLQAQNDNVSFDNLKITVLNADGSTAMQADKTVLKEAIAAYDSFDVSEYTEETVSVYAEAVEAARKVAANIYATQEQVDEAAAAIDAAIKALVKLNPDPENPENPEQPGKPEEPERKPIVYTYNFDSADDLKDFSAYHLPLMDYDTHKVGASVDWTQYWELATDNDGNTLLQRKNLTADETPCTERDNSMLYLNTQKFSFFEAEMTFKFGDSWGWTQLCFGAAGKGNHMHHDNAGIYMQQEGYVNLSCPGGNDVEVKDVNNGFTKGGLHTIKLRVVQGSSRNTRLITVWVDGIKKIEKEVQADNFSDRAGWISIQSQNDNIAVDSLKVSALKANGEPAYDIEPQTGDSTSVVLFASAMVLSVIALGAVLVLRKRRAL